jgi:ATP-dependent Clp protease, protease subunit
MADNIKDTALGIWNAQNELLLDYGIDVIGRSFCLSKDIGEHTFAEIDAKLSILERDLDEGSPRPITIKLNSVGGSIYDAWAIVSRIKSSPCPITMEAYGCVMSAATMIFLAGKKKRVSKYCEFMFHQSSIGLEGSINVIQNVLKSMGKEEEMYCTFLQENSKKSRLFWKKLINSNKDVFLTAEQVLKLGLAEEIF